MSVCMTMALILMYLQSTANIRAGHMSDHLTIYTIFCIPDDTPWTHFGPPSFTIDFCMPESAHTSTQSVQPSAARSTTSC
ncbi:hypothetical protein PF010_g33213 [Phytophthora fragariae]|uniref:Secreted protein n=1 Tax=Phytophthora fragariae TaxID=53985 RepID=A0A6A4AS21_9STRA|nr:hypothetical protein PF009_g32711 [Phytophthora fragariae]KAE8951165.1 hypothetical protein PF011_g33038 [Phytophthora fragariae]KAE9048344.1 hypothetical protein PF010_g33213 [Phytophthora fragariae]KAE9261072.1 hypothetical protein PF001_g32531 [Phytophthora fragariae]